MEFDLKTFFRDPPRLKDEVKQYVHALATKIVTRLLSFARLLGVERVLPRHVRALVFHMCPDPYTLMTRGGLSSQQARVKPVLRLLHRALNDTEARIATEDAKYGGIEKRIVKGVAALVEEASFVRASHAAVVCIAACVAEICGLVLNAAQQGLQGKQQRTLCMDHIREYGTMVSLSNGEVCFNASLARLLYSLDQRVAAERGRAAVPLPRCDTAAAQERPPPNDGAQEGRAPPRNKTAERAERSMRSIERRNVRFDARSVAPPPRSSAGLAGGRPTTPSDCFWEDD